MSEAISALNGAGAKGFATVTEIGPQGMITLRGDLSTMKDALAQISGTLPDARGITHTGGRSVAWMSPDELLILLPYDQVGAAIETLNGALAGTHFLAVNVSDARAIFTVSGAGNAVRETLAKLAPVDLSPEVFKPGEIRRTRIAQIAAAFWLAEDGTAHVICFRSVAQYAFDLLKTAASDGAEVGYF
ncbi:MAG: sarcosine oxidase subunit gamma [Thalassovita sp.]